MRQAGLLLDLPSFLKMMPKRMTELAAKKMFKELAKILQE